MITADDMVEMAGKFDKAQEDSTPFLVTANDKVQIMGNPNKTERKNYNYKIMFGIPRELKDRIGGAKVLLDNGYELVVEVEFKNVFVPNKYRVDVVSAVTGVLPFLKKVTPDNEIVSFTYDEYAQIIGTLNHEVMEAVYTVVRRILRIDEDIAEYMSPISAIATALKMMDDMPDVLNEADLFTASFAERG